ncbi:helix-turn-helix transcriptional regulator [Gordonia malaquae]|uniref:helix-turn-helix transcriptional regulator n=1 Tax=Gordonia malaquae TaxID=410332 RepID=UPI0030FE3D37
MKKASESADPLWTPTETGDFLKLPVSTLKSWRALRRGPAWIKLSSQQVRYRKSAVEEWLATQEVDLEPATPRRRR